MERETLRAMKAEDTQEIEDRLVAMIDLGLSLMVPADAPGDAPEGGMSR